MSVFSCVRCMWCQGQKRGQPRPNSVHDCTDGYIAVLLVIVAEWSETLTATVCVASDEADKMTMYPYVCLPCGSPSKHVLDRMASISSHAFIRKRARRWTKKKKVIVQVSCQPEHLLLSQLADPHIPQAAPRCCTPLQRHRNWHWQMHVGTTRTYIQ